MKKKILTILLCGVLVLGLTGCGKEKLESNNSSNENSKNDYKNISTLSNVKNRDTSSLFMFKNKLYIRSNGVIDYIGCDEYIGQIDTLIDKNLVPKNNGETNNKQMLNANICSADNKNAVIEYNGEFVLFEFLK